MIVKGLDLFYKHPAMGDGHLNYCIECKKIDSRKWRKDNPEKLKILTRSWYERNKARAYRNKKLWAEKNSEKMKKWNAVYFRKRTFGLSDADYLSMLEKQNKLCAICFNGRKLCVDHCHKTGRIRGLLCRQCNTVLGNSYDNRAVLQSAIEYLSASAA